MPVVPARPARASRADAGGIDAAAPGAQDGGAPQAGTRRHPAWKNPRERRLVVCLGLVDPVARQRWMIEATPDFREQLHRLDAILPAESVPGLDGIFLTHASMGHYTGLVFLGHESIGAREVLVHAMPRLAEFLSGNGPWDQLVRLQNIRLAALEHDVPVTLNPRLRMTPLLVPHRQEYSEVVGFRIEGPGRRVLFIPDIDRWKDWEARGVRVEHEIARVDVAYLDGTFYENGEIPGRHMSTFPHPFIVKSMERFASLPARERGERVEL